MDWKWTITAVLPVFTLVLGAWLNQLSESRRESAALKKEVRIRQLDRELDRLAKREEFELKHLAEASEYLRNVHLGALLTAFPRLFDQEPVPDGSLSLVDSYGESMQEMNRLTGLILDDQLRGVVHAAVAKVSHLRWTEGEHFAQTAVDTQAITETAQDALTKRLREIYGAAGAFPRSLEDRLDALQLSRREGA
ncbi:hypothetical protein AB8A21_17550 [Streptomyces sp. BF23-18]|uniref:hypothetical protein n=1 Tax=Streptomyces sp. BF23-18 TaxID=3240282 RepID=UPI0034E61C8B